MANRDIALALSGGGYRAALFHLGVLKQLSELNLLDRIAIISSVSGGSIVAGAYAYSLAQNQDFETFLSTTTRFLQRRALDWPALLWEVLPWQASARRIEQAFAEWFSNDGKVTLMSDLKGVPQFVFNATAVHSGRGWSFLSGGIAEEWELGQTHGNAFSRNVDRYSYDVSLARAVTASAAFPVFSAVTIDRAGIREHRITDSDQLRERAVLMEYRHDLTNPVCLSDGGVRDNSALTSIIAGHEPAGYEDDYYLIASDAGSIVTLLKDPPRWMTRVWPKSWLPGPPRGRVRKLHYLRRQLDIMGHHNNRIIVALALQLHRTRATSTKGMAMLRIDEPVVERNEQAGTVAALTQVPTRLKWPPLNTAAKLTEHGANLLWARLSEYTDLADHQLMPQTVKRRHKDVDPREEALMFAGKVLAALQRIGHGSIVDQAIASARADADVVLCAEAEASLERAGMQLAADRSPALSQHEAGRRAKF